jgi:hypothetical protein
VWAQIFGVPPKWSNWSTFMQISSSLGNMIEVDWNSLFASFFGMVRVKIVCKDLARIPKKRLFEKKKKLYLIQFKLEGESELKGVGDDNNDDDSEHGSGDDTGIVEIDHDLEDEVGGSFGGKRDNKDKSQPSCAQQLLL